MKFFVNLFTVTAFFGLINVSVAQYQTVGIIGSATPSGWDASTPMTQSTSDPDFWVLNNVALLDGEAKFRANDAWDVNWGNTDFPFGFGALNGANIPVSAGTYDITFNSNTGEYLFIDINTPTYGTVGVIGSGTPAGWDASTPLDQSADNPHFWSLADVTITDGEAKFRADNDWAVNWGNTDFPSGTAFQDGANIPVSAGTYDITFNDVTGNYTFIADNPPTPTYQTVGIIGSATPNGWDASTAMEVSVSDPNAWSITVFLQVGEMKFRADNDWAVNWGATDFPSGTASQDGPNLAIASADYYTIDFNSATGAYNFAALNATTYGTVGIIGSSTPSGWDTSTAMDQDPVNPHVWTLTDISLVGGEAKFRADNDWAVNWGNTDFPTGTAFQNGANIPVAAGNYDITFNDFTGAYDFATTSTPIPPYGTVGIIGSATPQGWDASTAMTRSDSDDHQWSITILLRVGEMKFRADNDWAVNWGGNDFPIGTGFQDGPNIAIPTEAYYEIAFNSTSGAYSFNELAPQVFGTVGIIGSATPQGWDASTPMTQDPSDVHAWTLSGITLTDGEAKFRADNDWAVNWGSRDFPNGVGTQDGANIPVAAGTYDIAFNDVTGIYSFTAGSGGGQDIVTLSPPLPTADEPVTLTYDATKGTAGLVGADKVYIHTGVILSGPTGEAWTNVVGNYGQDDGIGEMTQVPGEPNLWEFTYPSIREYYTVDDNTPIFRLGMVFRNANGSAEGKSDSGGDIYVDIDPGNFVRIVEPAADEAFVLSGENVRITAEASDVASNLEMSINGTSVATEANANSISYSFPATTSETLVVTVTGTVSGEAVSTEKEITVVVRQPNVVAALPSGAKEGINYSGDPTQVLLVLTAPGKDFVYAVGDFSNWTVQDEFQMNQTPDGEQFWTIIEGLTPSQEYIYQYWVDGTIKIGDPFADKVVDPFNDNAISDEIYPGLLQYDDTDNGIATVFQTNQTPYVFNHPEPVGGRPANEELVIYELLVRDFLGSHSYDDLIDTLDYVQRLGVNAIELMPIMEFEGNESWGYNPSYLFAPDKYYGTKDDLKRFIDEAHGRGMVVLLDMVLNHQFGQSPMVQMYYDAGNGRPSADNPWFNVEATHPFNVGFDMNHESQYTKDYIDLVNRYWVEEYEFDGYRFDLSKGFTQNVGNDPSDVGAWSGYDQSRVDIITRMADEIWAFDPNTYVILEHLGDNSEEIVLANYGMMLWGNLNHNYRDVVNGNTGSNLDGVRSDLRGWDDKNLIAYMESHDEERLVYGAVTEGLSSGNYNIQDTVVALERVKLATAFYYTVPGPKMLWQFGELGYDFSINFNSRIGNKPIPWGDEDGLNYHLDPDRQKLYKATQAIITLVNENNDVFEGGNFDWDPSGQMRQINITHSRMNVTIVGNFGLSNGTITPTLPHGNTWYDFFAGEAVALTPGQSIELAPGEFHIYTDQPVNFPEPGLVRVFKPIISVSPGSFTKDQRIQLTFDATAADGAGTAGLLGAEKVYLYAGVISDSPTGTNWQNITGSTDQDDGIGLMTQDPDNPDRWSISLRPSDYFNVDAEQPVYRIAMYFRDADGSNVGKDFGNKPIYLEVVQPQQVVVVDPAAFDTDTEVRIVFDATEADPAGTVGLVGSDKVYMHSGAVIVDTDTPTGGDWSNVVGNWGQDDGIGQMTAVAGETDKWEITLTPRDYYGLAPEDELFYLAMVFRNANGSAEGKGEGGTDIFIRSASDPVTAPDSLTGIVGDNSVVLNWRDNSSEELGYVLQRSTDDGSFATLAYLSENATTFTDDGLADGTSYTYRVQATSAYGQDSDFSDTFSFSLPFAAPDELIAEPVARRRIDLTWNDNSAVETDYVVERTTRWGKRKGRSRVIATLPANATSFADSTVRYGVTYFYRVVAMKDSVASDYSNWARASTRFIRHDEPTETDIVTIYPNPADNEVNFELDEDFNGLAFVTIYTGYGRPLDSFLFRPRRGRTITVNTSGYDDGVYLVSIFANGKRYIKRLYVEH